MEYRNSDMLNTINEYIHNRKYRDILRLRFCDALTYEEIAAAVNFSPQHVKAICAKHKALLFSRI